VVTAMLILCATLMILCSSSWYLWLSSDKPLIAVTVQIVNTPEPTRLILNQRAGHVFA
jgi:hypothetical protein